MARRAEAHQAYGSCEVMESRFESIALTGNWRDPRVTESVSTIQAHLSARDVAWQVSAEYPGTDIATDRRFAESALPQTTDLLVAVGGDGTMLKAAQLAAAAAVPLLGINRGRLGFLADITPDAMLAAVDHVLAGDYAREERMLLAAEVTAPGVAAQTGLALNDVVVKRLDSGRMFEFQTFVDGKYVNTHAGDGLIVATPTGSTAYALSCGGPILTPTLDAIVLAPICPHTLSDRPIVVPGASAMEIKLRKQDEDQAAVCCDGNVIGDLSAGGSLSVHASTRRLTLVHPPGHDFYEVLRGKLHWGRNSRNGPETD